MKLIKRLLPLLAIVGLLVYSLLVGRQVTIEGIGRLSLESNTALATGNVFGIGNPLSQQEKEPVEQIWMRTKNSKVFHSYAIHRDYHDIYLDAVHYEVGYDREIDTLEGIETIYWTTWEDINNTLEPAGELSPWDWQMVKADYNVYVLEDFTFGQILKFEKADPHGTVLGDVAFQPMALQWTNNLDQIQEVSMPQSGLLSVTDNKIQWDNAYGSNIDFSWTCYSTRLVKLLTVSSLNDLPTPEQFIIDGGNPALELNLIFDPSRELDIYIDGELWDKRSEVQTFDTVIEFRLGAETLWGFMPLRVWDSSGDNELSVIQRLRKVGSNLYVSIGVPYNWIQNAIFPIYIDTAVDEWVEASSDDANEIVADGSMDLTDTIIDLGSYTSGATNAGFRFTGVDTTDVENVQNAYLEFYPASDDTGAVSYTWYGENIANATTFTSAIYNISSRARTTVSVTENSPANWAIDTQIQTADLSGILNEVFSRGDWVSGNDLAILNIYGSGNGERLLRSWDYNDHSKAPKLHFENPTEVTYYWDAYDRVWDTNPANMVDGNLATFASTASTGDLEDLSSTTGDGTDLGTITKVELRAYAYGDGDDQIVFQFSLVGTDYYVTPAATEGWTAYVDVTSDSFVNGWTWAKVADLFTETNRKLEVEFTKVGKGNTMYCAKVEIRVTYTAGVANISNTPNSYNFGVVAESGTPATGLTHFTVTNSSGANVTISIKAIDWTGGAGWTLSDTATPGSDTVGLKAGLEGGDYTIIVKKTATYNDLVAALSDNTSQNWGLKLYAPTSHSDGAEKTTTVTLTATLD